MLLVAAAARASDVGVDVSGTLTTSSSDNPRAGAASVGLSGAWDLNDAWSLTGFALYTRDFATRTQDTSSSGSNVWLLNLGAMWLPSEHLMTLLSVVGSPPTQQRNATSVTLTNTRTADVVIDSSAWSLGALWNGLWASNGFSNLEHTIDVSAGVNRFSVFQQGEVPNTPAGRLLRVYCNNGGAGTQVCGLVKGTDTALWQGRLGVGYAATLFVNTELGVDGTYYLYDKSPSSVGYFSLLSVGRTDLGSGVPVLPLQLLVRPHVLQRVGPVTLKLTYQLGLYTEGLGVLHALSLRASWKVTKHWRLSATVTGQLDVSDGAVLNPGGQALLGLTYVW